MGHTSHERSWRSMVSQSAGTGGIAFRYIRNAPINMTFATSLKGDAIPRTKAIPAYTADLQCHGCAVTIHKGRSTVADMVLVNVLRIRT